MKYYGDDEVKPEQHDALKTEVNTKFCKLTRIIVMIGVVAVVAFVLSLVNLFH